MLDTRIQCWKSFIDTVNAISNSFQHVWHLIRLFQRVDKFVTFGLVFQRVAACLKEKGNGFTLALLGVAKRRVIVVGVAKRRVIVVGVAREAP